MASPNSTPPVFSTASTPATPATPPTRPASTDRYWCHTCQAEISPNFTPELVCSQCNGDFVEVMEEEAPMNVEPNPPVAPSVNFFTASFPPSPAPPSTQPFQAPPLYTPFHPFAPFAQPATYTTTATPTTTTATQTATAHAHPPDPFTQIFTQLFGLPAMQAPTANFVFHNAPTPTPNATHTAGGAPVDPLMQGINGLLGQLFGGDFGAVAMNNFFSSMGMRGNPGDYAWGRNFQDVLNQLFHQSGHRGNPPASNESLNSLTQSKEKVTQQQIDDHLDCAICKEEFNLEEDTIKLPCTHHFHETCIVTWLKMKNQCPMCRFEFPTDDPDYEERKRQQQSSSSTTTSSSTSPSPSTSTSSSSSTTTSSPSSTFFVPTPTTTPAPYTPPPEQQ